MTRKQEIQLFEDKKVRTVWDSESERWYFCVVDVIEVLTDSKNPTDYIKKMKSVILPLLKGGDKLSPPLLCQRQEENKESIAQHKKVIRDRHH